MKKMIIFEPAMCCSTGVCGPGVDPKLLRVSTVINNLKNKGIIVERYNLSSNPQAFVDNKVINEMLNTKGIDILPLVMVDGKIVKIGDYPSNEEFSKMLDIPENYIKTTLTIKSKGCGCKDGCC